MIRAKTIWKLVSIFVLYTGFMMYYFGTDAHVNTSDPAQVASLVGSMIVGASLGVILGRDLRL